MHILFSCKNYEICTNLQSIPYYIFYSIFVSMYIFLFLKVCTKYVQHNLNEAKNDSSLLLKLQRSKAPFFFIYYCN